ncbi:3-hydroxyacyl-ACP dehydratase FabZ family protein [Rubinisphaera margarita]|uniref:3-hydroxyacyl-ACP dehydratase FabZ family protein n=1 Tax=Rubinisphaera margarita TaxID=2909586 RepID=UPI001EE7FD3C|nr:3-hydroxyacyl-ACP dehydratase FabZ family protein [Rubinisphaera margarita]MCG6157584.1 beta-hydroxyacyl-ACP dehydratase [Rubinisphaera margarita]
MPPRPLFDIEQFDYSNPLYTLDEIRKVNPQRHEMEQLTAVVHVDEENDSVVGFKDVTENEFWCTGHMPGFPLMPGVVLCECAAQLAGFYARKYDLLGGDYLGFGGMDDVRFRAPVYPNSRLILAAVTRNVRFRKRAEFEFQGFVNGQMVFSGHMIGVSINRGTGL